MFCQKCGAQMQEGARFCPKCGHDNAAGSVPSAQQPVQTQPITAPVQQPIQPTQPAAPVQQPMQPEKKSKKTGVVIGAIVGGLVIVVLILVVLLGKGGDKPSDTIANSGSNPAVSDENPSAADAGVNTADSKISADYRSGEILIDGDLITLPMPASDFMALGWTPDDYDADDVIEAKADRNNGEWKSTVRMDFVKGGNTLDVTVCNWTNQEVELKDGYVVDILTDDDSSYSVMIPGEFETQMSAKDAIVAAWGDPDSERSINDEMYKCEYEITDDAGYNLKFSTGSDMLIGAQIYNYDKTSARSSANRVNTVDPVAANAIRNKDSFEVQVKEMQIVEGYYNTGNVNFVGNDAFVFSVANNGDADLTKVEILVVGFKENGELVQIKSGVSVPVVGSDKYITVVTNENDLSIESGDVGEIALQCDAREYYGAEALIYSYTDANGQRHENPLAQEWINTIYER